MSVAPPVQKILKWRLFSRPELARGKFDIIKWWEFRRIPYNLVVGAVGIITLFAVLGVDSIAEAKLGEPFGFPDPPIFALFAIIAYGIGANVLFTGGWIAEIFVREIWPESTGAFAQISFCLGLLFSILLTLVPAAIFTAMLIVRLLLH
jgi:hypothetical protein